MNSTATRIGLAVGLALLAWGAEPAWAQQCAKIHDVSITWEFEPKELVIEQGDCVRWTNVHTIEHSAGGFGREFNTGQLMPGGRSLITFDNPGEIPYWCLHHPVMQAKLTVKKK